MAEYTLPEEWRPVTGWHYEVSSHGRLRPTKWARSNPTQRPLKPDIDKDGYHVYTMMVDGKKWRTKVHRLVCEAWHGTPPFEGAQARHLDDNVNNNDPGNLAWGTPKQNTDDRYINGSIKFGDQNKATVHSEAFTAEIRDLHANALLGRNKRVPKGWVDRTAAAYGLTRKQLLGIIFNKREK